MIEQQTIDGRPVTVTYLDAGFGPVDKDAAALVKLSFDDGEVVFLSTDQPGEQDGEAEAAGWNKHRERHRAPVVAPTPFALRRASRHEQSPHNTAIRDFALAMMVAEKPRATLKKRFGYNDKQIGSLALAYMQKMRKRRT